MPFVRIRGYLFGFFVSEPPNEPPHIHVKGKGGSAKLWLESVQIVQSGYSKGQTREIVKIAKQEQERFMEMWREQFGGE